MLVLSSLIWLVPGVIGLWAYNRWLSQSLPQVEGWAYLFAVVIFATPHYFIVEFLMISANSFKFLDSPELMELYLRFVGLFVSILVTILLARYFAAAKNKYSVPIPDPFYQCCYLWRKKIVFITLKSERVYLAWLMDYTKDSRFEFTIKIIPIYSGYREPGKVIWACKYPIVEKMQEQIKVDTVIPKREIVNFSLWNKDKSFKDAPQLEGLVSP